MNEVKKELTVGQMLGCTKLPLIINYNDGRNTYVEYSDGNWVKRKYDSEDNLIHQEDSDGFWLKYERDSNGNQLLYEDSDSYWCKWEYDSKGNQNYFENSYGYILDDRPKVELSLKDIADKFSINVKQVRVKE